MIIYIYTHDTYVITASSPILVYYNYNSPFAGCFMDFFVLKGDELSCGRPPYLTLKGKSM